MTALGCKQSDVHGTLVQYWSKYSQNMQLR